MLTLVACQKDKQRTCLDSKLEEFKASPNAIAIRTQEVNGETHYWFQTTASSKDLGDSIMNESCEFVCSICGECPWTPCMYNYDETKWDIIWEK